MATPAGTGPALRLVRAAVFASVCVLTAALGHSLASGHPLPAGLLAGAAAATTAAAWWPARVERGALPITVTTVGTQLALHVLFSLAPPPGGGHHPHHAAALPQGLCAGGAADPAARAVWRAHTGAVVPPGPESPLAHAVELVTHGSWPMFLAHVLAALVCGLWMWRGEAGFFAIVRSLRCALFEPLRLVLGGFPRACLLAVPRAAPVAPRPSRPRDPVLRHSVSRRGPPRGCPVPR
ncbi:hypothetical protein [Streptomyces sudanensis]|uniref:hypothetical protein n=1 Tax=Streptomyces sudanensis TaxID=436397 RepID=UPI0020CCF62B|nr:hypothetical protein [Streptomyces sudanensis]MCP9958540.1 hypothetical protein [Streptomyces sudanensis]MCQ0000950.1 hypothetical protein [Streptomyces sudanensis]